MTNLINDLSTLSSVATYNLNSLCKLSETIISHSVAESLANKEDYATVDIGIGTLFIKRVEDEIRYKFVPSDRLDKVVTNTYKNGKSDLEKTVDEVLGRRIMNTYKDLF